MFDNVGRQIKTLSKFLFWVGIILSVIIGFFYAINDTSTALLGLIILICGCFGSWVSSLLLYGFGQLIENTDKEDNDIPNMSITNNGENLYLLAQQNALKKKYESGKISKEKYEEEINKLF